MRTFVTDNGAGYIGPEERVQKAQVCYEQAMVQVHK